jgi:hypothetical protein
MQRTAARRMSSHWGNAALPTGTEHWTMPYEAADLGRGCLTDRAEGFADAAYRSEADELSLVQRRTFPRDGAWTTPYEAANLGAGASRIERRIRGWPVPRRDG